MLLFALTAYSAGKVRLESPTYGAEPAPGESPEITAVRVGFDGSYKAGVWTPVTIGLSRGASAPGATVTVTVPDGDGVPSRVSAPIPVVEGPTEVALFVRFGRVESDMTVELAAGGEVATRREFRASETSGSDRFPPAIAAHRSMFLVVGADMLGADQAADALQLDAEDRIALVHLPDCSRLPAKWYGYEGVDLMVVSAGSRTMVELTEEQAGALDEWIALGGRLVLCVGQQAGEVLAEGSRIARFVPGRFESVVSLRQTGGLETFVGSSVPIPAAEGQRRAVLPACRLAEVEGVVEASEADLPLLVRSPRGFGQIILFAADLDRGLLTGWKDRPRLAAKVLGLPAEYVEQARDVGGAMHLGFNDLAGQLRGALDQFEGVRVVAFSAVVGLIVLYLLLIGPIDYFFLNKVLRRMQWTWLTFPAIVIVFSAGAYLLTYKMKGDEVRLRQAVLIDVDAASGRLRGTSWASLFSPRVDSFDLSVRSEYPGRADAYQPQPLVSWFGLPGKALGGMDPRAANPVVWTESYDFAPELEVMEGVPVPAWSSKSLTARWTSLGSPCPEAKLTDDNLTPLGTIKNTFDFPLQNCFLVYRRWAYNLGTLEPGQVIQIDPMLKRSELKTLLTGRKIVFTEKRDKFYEETTPYDQASVNPTYVLRAMMFYEEAGGKRYTRFANGYQRFVDFSELLKTNRAVLVAEGPRRCPGVQWLRGDAPLAPEESERVTVYRFVYPIEEVKKNQARP
jgi:hypothetical protein